MLRLRDERAGNGLVAAPGEIASDDGGLVVAALPVAERMKWNGD